MYRFVPHAHDYARKLGSYIPASNIRAHLVVNKPMVVFLQQPQRADVTRSRDRFDDVTGAAGARRRLQPTVASRQRVISDSPSSITSSVSVLCLCSIEPFIFLHYSR